MKYYPFLIHQRPRCYWGPDLDDQERSFLSGLDPDYFSFLADQFAAQLEGENAQRAAIALRTSYHHAIETFLALAGATIQAPGLTVAWVHEYRTHELRKVVMAIQNEDPSFRHAWKGVRPITWEAFAQETTPEVSERSGYDIRGRYVTFWKRLAHEFLNETHAGEYNSIKHGFRARPGAVDIKFGPEQVPGQPANPKEMRLLDGGGYGASYFIRAQPDGITSKSDPNWRLIQHSLNWNPESIADRLRLISFSLRNLLSWLRVAKGLSKPECVEVVFPTEERAFEECWHNDPNLLHSSIKMTVSKETIQPKTAAEIRQAFEDNDD